MLGDWRFGYCVQAFCERDLSELSPNAYIPWLIYFSLSPSPQHGHLGTGIAAVNMYLAVLLNAYIS